jgi:hypothetical protein
MLLGDVVDPIPDAVAVSVSVGPAAAGRVACADAGVGTPGQASLVESVPANWLLLRVAIGLLTLRQVAVGQVERRGVTGC